MLSQEQQRQIANCLKQVMSDHSTDRADAAAILGMLVLDLVMSFPAEERLHIAHGFSDMVARIMDRAAERFPEEFGDIQKH